MRELVQFVAKSLVDEPEQISVVETEGERGVVIELRVAPGDLGKVIGRQGRTARAIRALLAAAGSKTRRRYVLDIVE